MMYKCWFHELCSFCDLDTNGLFIHTDATEKQLDGIERYIRKRYTIWATAIMTFDYHSENIYEGVTK